VKSGSILFALVTAGLSSLMTLNSVQATEDIVFNPAIFAAQSESRRDGVTLENTDLQLNINAGKIVTDEFYLGLKYLSSTMDQANDDSSADSKTEFRAFGISGGYFSKNSFSLIFSWLIDPEYSIRNSSNLSVLKGGSGYLFDLGWRTRFQQSWFVGPQVTYTSVTYKKVEENGTTTPLDSTWSDKSISPYLGLWFLF